MINLHHPIHVSQRIKLLQKQALEILTFCCIIFRRNFNVGCCFITYWFGANSLQNFVQQRLFYRNFSLVLQLFLFLFFSLANLLDGRYGHKIHHFIKYKNIHIYVPVYICVCVERKSSKTLPRTLNEEHFRDQLLLLNELLMLKYFTYIFKETGFIVVPFANSTIAIWKYTLLYFSVTLTIQSFSFGVH